MKGYKLIKKCYEVNFDKIEEGYLASEKSCLADSIGKAKSQLWGEMIWDDWKLKYTDTEVSYLNIPVRRSKEGDLYEFEGKNLQKWRIENILDERIRLEILENLRKTDWDYFYIMKNGVYYKPNSCGYTDFQHRAGIYEKKEAISSAISCSELRLEPINVDEHNKMLRDEINRLKSRIIVDYIGD